MEAEAEAAEERGGKERVAAVGRDEVELDVGSEVEKAIEEGEIGGEGSQADEEEEEEEAAAAAEENRAFEVRFRRVWFCKPLTEAEFSDDIKGLQPEMSFFGISYQQVLNLVNLFSSKRISLEPYQKPKSRVIWDYNVSLALAGLGSSLHKGNNAFPRRPSSMLCNNRISAPHSSFMYAKHNAKHAAYNYGSSLHPPRIKSVIFKAPDIKEQGLEPDADFIPLDLDDCKSDSDTAPSDLLGPVGLYSAIAGSISCEDQDPEPFNGKHNEDGWYPAPVLNQSFISLSETSENSAIAHFMKERQSSMLGRGCKRRATIQFDGHSHLPSSRSCTIGEKVPFSFEGDKISVTSDKALNRPALAELKQNREAVTKERKWEVGYSVQDAQSRSGDDDSEKSKLVVKLLHLFSSRNRLQPRQNPSLQDERPRESEISSVINQTDNQSGSNSSHGSFKSPGQTCTSSTVGEYAASPSHKLAKPMSIMHKELQPDISDVAKSNSSRTSFHTAANTDIVPEPGTQQAMDDESTDDYIPLQMEEDDGVDNMSDLLGEESQTSESKGSSDSEEHTTFHQSSRRKKDDCDQPMANSKLRADIEGRKSVFARLIGRPKSFSQRDKSMTKPFAPIKARSQRKKKRRAQQNKVFPRDNSATIDIPLADKVTRIPALNYSFVRGDDRRSNKFFGGKPSNIQTGQHPYLCEENEWDVCAKEPDRSDAFRKLFVPEDSRKLTESCDRALNKSPVFAEVHESCEVTVKEEIRTPFSDFKRRAKDPNVEGGDADYDTEDVDEAARKKTRLASASYHREEYQSETALVPKDTKPTDILTISDGDCKLKSIALSSTDTSTQMARAYLQTEVLLQDEQQRIQSCCEDITGDKLLILEDFGNVPKLSFGNRQPVLNVETRSEVAFGHLETETYLQEKQNQSAKSCYGVVNTDKMLLLGKHETMDFSPNQDEDCRSKMCFPSDGITRHVSSSHLVPEMPLHQKQTLSVQSCSQVVHGYEVLVPENSEEMLPKFDPNCDRNKSLSSDEAYNYVEASRLEIDVALQEQPYQRAPSSGDIVNAADQALCQESSVTLDTSPKSDGDRGKNSLSSDGIVGYVASDFLSPESHGDSAHKNISPHQTLEMASTDPQETCKVPQDKLFRGIIGVVSSVSEYSGTMDTSRGDGDSAHKTSFCQTDAEATYSLTDSENHEDTKPMDVLTISDGSCELKSIGLSSNDTCTQIARTYLETEMLQQVEQQRTQGCCEDVTGDRSLILEDSGKNMSPKLSFGNMQTIGETRRDVDVAHVETEASLQEKQNQSARSCYGVVNTDDILHLENPETMDLSPNHDEDGILQMLATDTSSVSEYSGTVDTATGEGHCENKTSFYQKVAEASYPPAGSEDHEGTTNTLPLSKAVPQPETRYQDLPSGHEAAYENSDSTDPFAVCAEGYGSRSGIPTGSTQGHLLDADLLGTNSESRTGFFDGSSSELAKMIMLAHDLGKS
ncbi:hypothetical protein ACQ4PT_009049 [Festuca glaucescens]